MLDLCVKHNIKLNFKKTNLGHKTAKFFGYELFENGYRIDDGRKKAISEIAMPGTEPHLEKTKKQVKSFLGFSVYFIHFVENYAQYASPLYEMTKDDFSWDKTTWKEDYEKAFQNL